MNFKTSFNSLGKLINKYSPEILVGLGLSGMAMTTFLAVKTTPSAIDKIKADSRRNHDGDPYAYTKKEAIKSAWKFYIPPAITFITSSACIISASAVHKKRNAAIATAYKITESALLEYRDKVIEKFGDKKEKEVRDDISADHVKNNPSSEVIITENGHTLFYEDISGRYFYSDIEKIRKKINELNKELLSEGSISLNEFYYELGLDGIKIGEEMGWRVDWGLINVDFGATLAKDDTPCITISYNVPPRYGFNSVY